MIIFIEQSKWINHFPLIRRCCCCIDSVSPNWIFSWKRLSIKHLLQSSSSKLSQNQRFNGVTYYFLLIITISTNLLKLDNTLSISQHLHINYLISLHAFNIFELLICANHCSRQEWGIKHWMESLYQVRQKILIVTIYWLSSLYEILCETFYRYFLM